MAEHEGLTEVCKRYFALPDADARAAVLPFLFGWLQADANLGYELSTDTFVDGARRAIEHAAVQASIKAAHRT